MSWGSHSTVEVFILGVAKFFCTVDFTSMTLFEKWTFFWNFKSFADFFRSFIVLMWNFQCLIISLSDKDANYLLEKITHAWHHELNCQDNSIEKISSKPVYAFSSLLRFLHNRTVIIAWCTEEFLFQTNNFNTMPTMLLFKPNLLLFFR